MSRKERGKMTGKLKMISAGAGAGKTYSLSGEMTSTIQHGTAPENIMATTFTVKAANELIERIRLRLLEAGKNEEAARILDGYVGTMNSVFGRLLREFALELGLSPVQNVLADNEVSNVFREVTAEINHKYYLKYYEVFSRIGFDDYRNDWRNIVEQVIEQARQNNLSPDEVRECANFSWRKMKNWLPEPDQDGKALDEKLRSALKVAKSQFPESDQTKATKDARTSIQNALLEWERNGYITWQQWARLSKLKSGKQSEEVVSPVIADASRHFLHPRLHDDLKNTIYALFHCAAEGMEVFQEEKSKRGFIDFTDQEALALELLRDEDNMDALKDRISEVFVDEVQDSSPLQVALIMRLREIAEKSTWVGDVKQAIYGFRGTDPKLMQTAMDHLHDMEVEVLPNSWRSRKSLVEFVNEVFVPVFRARGMEKERIKLNPVREDDPKQRLALETWAFPHAKNKKADAAHVALGVEQVLAEKEQYVIIDKNTKKRRSLKPSDIAILCRTNEECEQIAEALGNRGIKATVGEKGLMTKPEVIFAIAALRYLIDREDTLAIAEIVHFTEKSNWLSEWLEDKQYKEKLRTHPVIKELDQVRENIKQMSPSEVLDLAIVTAKVDEVVVTWGQGNQRLANLDALRKLATIYEDQAETKRTAASISGFLLFLLDIKDDDERNEVAESTDDFAVQVLTYHKAKGLEWPFVILYSLNKQNPRKLPVFDAVIPESTEGFHVENPLYGRKLYYWPWPYGRQTTKVGLDSYVSTAPELREKQLLDLEESQRLMYVGMTRARDYLVFANRNFSRVNWINELIDEKGNGVIRFDVKAETVGNIVVNGEKFPCQVRVLQATEEETVLEQEAISNVVYLGKRMEKQTFKPARFAPSELSPSIEQSNDEVPSSNIMEIGARLPLAGQVEMDQLGDLVHAFLAADNLDFDREQRLTIAKTLINNFDVYALTPKSLLEANERFMSFIYEQYSKEVKIYKEWPIHIRKGLQTASGWIDMLLETEGGYVIIDHKTFPGKQSEWFKKAKSYLPQLQIYAEAIWKATRKPVIAAWIHMPVVGAMVHFSENELKQLIHV